jgi:hypothetical protein
MNFALMPRPRGGEWLAEEISGWHAEGLRTVVSLLEGDEAIELELGKKEALCNSAGLRFISYPIPDRGVPGVRAGFTELVNSSPSDCATAIRSRCTVAPALVDRGWWALVS